MVDRKPILQLSGKTLKGSPAILLLYELDGNVEFVVTERHGGDARVVISNAQLSELLQELRISLESGESEDAC